MNKQQVFNTVSRHLFTQGRRSFGLLPKSEHLQGCLYRGPDDTKCAVGCLIPDNQYRIWMEGQTVFNVVHRDTLTTIPEVLVDHTALLSALQKIHDMSEHWLTTKTMRAALRRVAKYNGLSCETMRKMKFSDRWRIKCFTNSRRLLT